MDMLPDPLVEQKAGPEQRDKGYFNLLSYIVSNAISGEIMAVENYSEMVQLMPDSSTRIETNGQAAEEVKHILMLSKLARNLGFTVEKRIVEPQWGTIRKHFSTAVRKNDLAACLIVQDLMTETMAIMLYRTLGSDADADERTAKVANDILADELEHLEIGVARLTRLLEQDRQAVHDALVWAHHRVMPELFSMISTSCHFLCDVLSLDCASLSLSDMALDLDTLRANALDQYIATLDRVGFDQKTVNPLVASMSAYGGLRSVALAGSGCCGAAASCGDARLPPAHA
jgi:fatty aldehyde decarbonylase